MCEHSAVLYRGEHDLSRRLRSSLQRAAAEEAAVLICLDSAAEARIRTDFGSICDRFTFRPADDRYTTPGKAMVALDRFVTAAEASGAASAWSIGAIPLRADGRDVRWMHYEEAVTNALVHGASPTVFEVWHEADGCALRVTDHGRGGVDRCAHLRPLQGGPHGGFGLFTVGQLADSVEFTRQDNTTVVSVYMAIR